MVGGTQRQATANDLEQKLDRVLSETMETRRAADDTRKHVERMRGQITALETRQATLTTTLAERCEPRLSRLEAVEKTIESNAAANAQEHKELHGRVTGLGHRMSAFAGGATAIGSVIGAFAAWALKKVGP